MSPNPHLNINQLPPPPHLAHSPTNSNNNTMDMAFPIKMKQSNKCESVKSGEIIKLHLGLVQALESASAASCKTPATFIDSIRPNNPPGKKQRIPK